MKSHSHLLFSKSGLTIICTFLLNFGFSHTSAKERESHSADLKTLKLVQVVFRHGDRTPIHEYPNDPYHNAEEYWPEGLGQLTKTGMMQQFLLGEYLRWRYDLYLSRVYNKKDLFVQSSNIDRTIMSAQANLAGLYPPTPQTLWNPDLKWQPIPVHSIPKEYDNILDFAISCPRYKEEFKEVINSAYVKQFKAEHQWVFDYLTENTGKTIETFEQLSDVYDTLFVQAQHSMALPAFASKVFPNAMKPLAEFHFRTLEYNDKLMQLRGGPLLKRIVDYMDLIREKEVEGTEEFSHSTAHLIDCVPSEKRRAKLYMYSGHDTSLSGLLHALGVYNSIVPPYASCVMIELHGTQTDSNSDFLKIFYLNNTKDFPYELEVPDCGSPCTLSRLKELKGHLMIKDWQKECQEITAESDIPIKEQVTSIMFFLGLATLLIVIGLKIYGVRRKRNFTGASSNSKLV